MSCEILQTKHIVLSTKYETRPTTPIYILRNFIFFTSETSVKVIFSDIHDSCTVCYFTIHTPLRGNLFIYWWPFFLSYTNKYEPKGHCIQVRHTQLLANRNKTLLYNPRFLTADSHFIYLYLGDLLSGCISFMLNNDETPILGFQHGSPIPSAECATIPQ